jgi:hypothetical protein
MQFQREPISGTLIDEISPLLLAHWHEIAHYKDIPLLPDFDSYIANQSNIRVFTFRDESGRLIGYNVFFLRMAPHYKDSVQAVQDILFLEPKHRKAMWGSKFIRWCDVQLQGEGVEVVYHHLKASHNHGRLLERQGYELVDLIYAKRLKKRGQHG